MNALRLLVSKNYWLYIFSVKNTAQIIFATVGVIWLVIESTSFFSQDLSNYFKSNWGYPLAAGLIWIIFKTWPKAEFCYKLKGRDLMVQISIGNLFNCSGDVIVPINTSLDTSFEDSLISKKSTQGQFTILYFKESRYLDQDIREKTSGLAFTDLPNKQKGNKYKCEIGTVIKLSLPKDKHAYLLASSDMNDNGVASTTFDNILISLGKLWDFIRNSGEIGHLNIPVIGSGRGRVNEPRETIIKAIIHSFVSATTSSSRFTSKLNIVIHPEDFKQHQINIRDLVDFLRLKTIHYDHDVTSSTKGEGIG